MPVLYSVQQILHMSYFVGEFDKNATLTLNDGKISATYELTQSKVAKSWRKISGTGKSKTVWDLVFAKELLYTIEWFTREGVKSMTEFVFMNGVVQDTERRINGARMPVSEMLRMAKTEGLAPALTAR